MKGQCIMNRVIKSTILLITFSLSGADIKVTTKSDVEILRLQLLYHIKANCSSENELMLPLCVAMKAFLERIDVLLQHGELNVSSLVIPVIEKFEGQLDTIKQSIKGSNQEIRVVVDDNVELHEQIASLQKRLENSSPSDMGNIYAKLQVLLEKYQSRVQ